MLIEGRILLVRHRAGGSAYHLLPGGGLEAGETIDEALQREVSEETGLTCRLLRPLFINDTLFPNGGKHVVNLTFLAEATGGEITETPRDRRVEGVELVRPEDLDEIDLRPPLARQIVEAADRGFDVPARYLGPLWTAGGR
jgi:8-oxo-dGTP diphosphatase